jgi:dTDP-4-dehydrorhamnose reductase
MILVFGKTGQVARELATLSGDVTCLDRAQADLSVPGACDAAIRAARPDAVINAGAFTDVDGAETQVALATRINGAAPGEMGRACADLDIPLVQISTDYVFDGSGHAPRLPKDPTGPLGVYGASKLEGETAVSDSGCRHAILRTSWVFSAHGENFVKTMLRLGAERELLKVVADQIGGPTPASVIAAACVTMAQGLSVGAPSGIHHLSGRPDISWADFARAVFGVAGLDCKVEDITTADWPTPAMRPANSRLDCTSLMATFGIARPDWRDGLCAVIKS